MNPNDMRKALEQAQQMQQRMRQESAALRIEASAGGGVVTVAVNGDKQLLSIKLDPEVVSKDDIEMLQDLIVTAVNDANRKADESMKQKLAGVLPPGLL